MDKRLYIAFLLSKLSEAVTGNADYTPYFASEMEREFRERQKQDENKDFTMSLPEEETRKSGREIKKMLIEDNSIYQGCEHPNRD